MPYPRFTYNAKTLRYERVGISPLSVVLTLFGLLFFGALFFVGLVYTQNYFIETPLEKSLRAENDAYSRYRVELTSNLKTSKNRLAELEKKDGSLYEKIFDAKKPQATNTHSTKTDKHILLADGEYFRSVMDNLEHRFDLIYAEAKQQNKYLGIHFVKDEVGLATSIPSFPPIANLTASKLASGFGMRVNPFHKGLYHHDGIDLDGPRGSEVLAAAAGRVSVISRSDLQAGYGNTVEIDHGYGYVTRYSRLGEIGVYYGQRIAKGQSLGTIGISGGSVAPHVHYEVLKDGKNLDPVRFLIHGIGSEQYSFIRAISRRVNQSMD
jgi:murein DD-endopeptidase MepM/ murein hydrolase activator NlpD